MSDFLSPSERGSTQGEQIRVDPFSEEALCAGRKTGHKSYLPGKKWLKIYQNLDSLRHV